MTKEEYKKELEKLDIEYASKRKKLHNYFAITNNSVNIGDIITDGETTIIVDKIKIIMSASGFPTCQYKGVKLTKAGNVSKNRKRGYVTQARMRSLNV
jgi:hypothetical protein